MENTTPTRPKLTLYISQELKQQIKVYCAIKDISVSELFREFVSERMKQDK